MRRTLALLAISLLTSCGQKQDDSWLGYAEGDQAMIAAPQPGWVESMKMERGKAVHRGDVLFVLDDTREAAGRDQAAASLQAARAALAQAHSSLAQEQANLSYTRTELGRQDRLAQQGIGTPTQRDAARNAFEQSQARIGVIRLLAICIGARTPERGRLSGSARFRYDLFSFVVISGN